MLNVPLLPNFLTLATGNVADAASDLVNVIDASIRALSPDMKLAGPAYTVECTGGNNLAILQACGLAPAGSVLVINVHGHMNSGHVGELVSTACRTRGLAGLVIDGACRDAEDIIKMKFPVFTRGVNPRGNLKLKNGTLNQVITCGGVQINPGDVIFGDASGILVFPANKAQEIYDKAKEIAIKEMGIVKMLHEGKTLLDILGLQGI